MLGNGADVAAVLLLLRGTYGRSHGLCNRVKRRERRAQPTCTTDVTSKSTRLCNAKRTCRANVEKLAAGDGVVISTSAETVHDVTSTVARIVLA